MDEGVLGKASPAVVVPQSGTNVADAPVTSDRKPNTKRGGGGGAESAL
jgi:hypothetical protein